MRPILGALAATLLTSGAALSAHAATAHIAYATGGSPCGGFPRAAVGTEPGMCAGLVLAPAGGARRIRMPRTLLGLDGAGRDWLVSDLGSWTPGTGGVWRLKLDAHGAATIVPVLKGLAMPHTLAKGPDGGVYVGEMGAILRFDPNATDPQASVVKVVQGLPDNRLHPDRHPLPAFLFMPDGALMVDVGAPTDDCAAKADRTPDGTCAAVEGPAPQAVLRRYAYLGHGRWSPQFTTVARGLRNSVALSLTPDGRVLQGENSIDFKPLDQPYDEINLIKTGAFYGWPYCFDDMRASPAWAARSPVDCKGPAATRPVLMLPPHSAPLAMLTYRGAMFPKLDGKLVVALHGYQPGGARVVAYALDASGVPRANASPRYDVYTPGGPVPKAYTAGPAATAEALTPGWGAVPGKRPMGGPAGLAVAPDGAIWVTDDRNGAILRLAADAKS